MALRLHGIIGSHVTFRCMVTLIEKDLDFEFVPIDVVSLEHKTPRFLTLNPFGQIPVFEDGDLTLFESRAINNYIAEVYADKGTNLTYSDSKNLAIQTVWMEIEGQKFDPASSKLVWELVYNPILGIATDDGMVAELEGKLAQVLDVYEQRLTESKYLDGDMFTLADLHHLPNIYYLMMTKAKSLFHARPHVGAWCDDILSRPAWLKVVACHASHMKKKNLKISE